MRERLQDIQAFSTVIRREIGRGISDRIDPGLRSLYLIKNPQARKAVDMLKLRGIEMRPIPFSLEEGRNAVLVSNYPSVEETIDAILKVVCRLPGKEPRLKAIGREEVVTEAGVLLMALGVDWIIVPAQKVDGVYRLKEGRKAYQEVLNHLGKPGSVLWLSVTGETRDSGLREKDLKTGAVIFSLESRVPIVPMGIVTEQGKVAEVKFGEPINPPPLELGRLSKFERNDCLNDYSRLVMCRIAELLPQGQRGSFNDIDMEKRIREINKRLEAYTKNLVE